MKIVNKETLAAMPIGTVFTLYEPHCMDGECNINDISFLGEKIIEEDD